jgi:hypothetical protein
VNLDPNDRQAIQVALQKLLQVSTPQESIQVFLQHPQLLTDEADSVFEMLITQAREQRRQSFVKVLSGLRTLAQEVRQNRAQHQVLNN